jgi:hypothetical protein
MEAGSGGQHPTLLYYRVVFSNVPLEFPLSTLANHLLPDGNCQETVAKLLGDFHVVVVPHRLHTFKEKLPEKYGHVDYYLSPAPGHQDQCTGETLHQNQAELQSLFLTWVADELTPTLSVAVPGIQVRVVGSPEWLTSLGSSAIPLLDRFTALPMCQGSADPLKIVVFLQTKLSYHAPGQCQLQLKDITIPQLAWLRGQVHQFPVKASSDDLKQYFEAALAPLPCEVVGLSSLSQEVKL